MPNAPNRISLFRPKGRPIRPGSDQLIPDDRSHGNFDGTCGMQDAQLVGEESAKCSTKQLFFSSSPCSLQSSALQVCMLQQWGGTCPLRETAVILLPWITTTESRTGAPPLPSISVPPSITSAGACCDCADQVRFLHSVSSKWLILHIFEAA